MPSDPSPGHVPDPELRSRDRQARGPVPGWAKFAHAFRGMGYAIRRERSVQIHLPIVVGVLGLGCFAELLPTEWGLIALTIGAVLAAELFNSALEHLARAVTDQHDERIGRALDLAAGAVLTLAGAAVAVGGTTLGWALWRKLAG